MGVSKETQKVFLTKSGLFKKTIDIATSEAVPPHELEAVLSLHGYSINHPSRKLTYKLIKKRLAE
jgi:hypothetical protein